MSADLDTLSTSQRAVAAMSGGGIARYEAACRAIAEAKAVDEIKDIHDKAKAMSAAARIAKNKQAEADMMEIRFRAERRLGELMAAQREAGDMAKGGQPYQSTGLQKNPVAAPTLSEAGIDKNLADRARKYAAIPEQEFNQRVESYRKNVVDEGERARADLLAAGDKHVRGTFGTGENEWYTPEQYIEAARAVFEDFDLDPATSEQANAVVKAANIYTKDDDGLSKEWHGRIWLNPPYAQPLIADFVFKLVDEYKAGRVTDAIMLTHNYTDTAWFQEAARNASAICFTRGRVKFVGANGEIAAPTQGQAFFYFGDDVESFEAEFTSFGFVACPRLEGGNG